MILSGEIFQSSYSKKHTQACFSIINIINIIDNEQSVCTWQKWKKALDENLKVGTTFIDLSKAFDTLNHRLLQAKLKAHGLQPTDLK